MTFLQLKRAVMRGLVATGLAVTGVAAVMPSHAASTPKSLSTNFTLVNLGTSLATVNVGYYTDSSATGTGGNAWTADAANTNLSLAANGGQAVIRQYTDGTLAPGKGSVVVSSDQALGAVVQILQRVSGVNATSGAYAGVSSPSSTYYVPIVARRGSSASGTINSQIIIQNAGSSAASVSVNFSNGFSKALTIAANASYYYDLDDETGITSPFVGSAVVSASGGAQIVVISNFFTGADGMQTFNAFPASSVGTTWRVPQFNSRLGNGLSTPVAVQNLSGSTIAAGAITLSCVGDPNYNGGSSADFSKTNAAEVLNNASYAFNPVTDSSIAANWQGACTVTAPGNVVSFVQMRFVGGTGNPNNAAAYEAINASGTNKTAFVPLVAKRLANGFATAVSIQNLSSSTATVTFRYKAGLAGFSDSTVGPYTIAAGGSLIHNHRLPGTGGTGASVHNLPDGWQGTLVVESDQPIDGFVQLTNYLNPAGDTFMAHNIFTQP